MWPTSYRLRRDITKWTSGSKGIFRMPHGTEPWRESPPSTSLAAEIARHKKVALISLCVDLTTFYETASHHKLVSQAVELGFPASLLRIALQVYRELGVISSENCINSGMFTTRMILAGCPIAPALAKVALHRVCYTANQAKHLVGLTTWLDDLRRDVEHKSTLEATKAGQVLPCFHLKGGCQSPCENPKKAGP